MMFILNCSVLFLFPLTFLSGRGFSLKSNLINERCRSLMNLIEQAKKMTNSEVSSETVNKLAEVLAWFNEYGFAHKIIELIFKKPETTGRQANLSDKQIQTVLLDFKLDGESESLITAFYSELPSTHQNTSIVEKKVLGKKLNRALKKQLKRGFTLIHILNDIWSENYYCWKALNHRLKKWKDEKNVGEKLYAIDIKD